MMERPVRESVLNTPVDCVNMAGALRHVEDFIRNAKRPATILAVNPEKVYAIRGNRFLKDFFQEAALLLPDGIGIVYALRLQGRRVTRVAGSDLMPMICAMAAEKCYSIFIYGASEAVNSAAVERLNKRFPTIRIVGRANGYLPPTAMDDLVARINRSGAQILFVALGSPRQEQWMRDYLEQLETVKVCQGIGGTLDTIVGTVRRAPSLMRKLNLEWLFRLLQQPSRAGRQIRLVQFMWEVGVAQLKRR